MRRRFKSRTGYPLATSPRDVARINRRSEKPFEMREPKRVRFLDGEMDDDPVRDSSRRREATESPRSDAPKTSEFAYFRKVKSGAVHGHSRPPYKENDKLRNSKLDNNIAETSRSFGMNEPSTKELKISVSRERTRPSDDNLFLSPRVDEHDEPDQRKRTDKSEERSSLLYENVTPVGQSLFSSSPHEASENSENEYCDNGIFSEKRRKLRQLAAQTLFSEVENPPKGFDFVSALMSRLFPKDNENNNDSSRGDADNSSKSLTLHESNNLEKGIPLSHKRDWDLDIPKISSERSSEIILSEWDTLVPRIPFHSCGTQSQVQDLLDQYPRSSIYRNSHPQHDLSFFLPSERYRSSDSFHFKGLDEFSCITGCPREEHHRPLLEWDFEWGNDRVDSSSFSNHDATNNLYDQKRFRDNVLDSKGLCSSFSNYYLEYASLPGTQDFRPSSDDVKCALTEPGRCAIALLSTPKCITLGEDRNEENKTPCDQNIFFSYRDQHWLKNEVCDNEPERDISRKCLSKADFATESHSSVFHTWQFPQTEIPCDQNIIFSYRDQHWLKNEVCDDEPERDIPLKWLSKADFATAGHSSIFHTWQFPQTESVLFSLSRLEEAPGGGLAPFSEGAFYRKFLSSNFQSPLDTFINRPLLLDHVSRNRSGQELYFDDDDSNEL